jgi:transposase
MSDVHVLAIDLAKRSFQVCATDRGGAVLFNRTLSGAKLMQMLSSQAPCIVAMEACATSHYWGRVAQGSGHDVRLIPPSWISQRATFWTSWVWNSRSPRLRASMGSLSGSA